VRIARAESNPRSDAFAYDAAALSETLPTIACTTKTVTLGQLATVCKVNEERPWGLTGV
jgi:Fe-S cluster assembly scaffold protein SufB